MQEEESEQENQTTQPAEQEPRTAIDTGLACLLLLGHYHGVAVEADQLRHEFGTTAEAFGMTEILLAAKKLGLTAKQVKVTVERLDRTPLPAMALDKNGGSAARLLLLHFVQIYA